MYIDIFSDTNCNIGPVYKCEVVARVYYWEYLTVQLECSR